MKFDLEKDKLIIKEVIDRNFYKLVVGLYSYDDGPVKLQLSKILTTKEGERFSKLGRLSKEDIEALIPVLQKLLPKMIQQGQAKLKEDDIPLVDEEPVY